MSPRIKKVDETITEQKQTKKQEEKPHQSGRQRTKPIQHISDTNECLNVKRSSSASEILTKITRPFKKKSKLSSPSVSFPSSSPITTTTGVLIPKLDIRSSSEECSTLTPQAYNGPPPSQHPLKREKKTPTLCPKSGTSDDEDNTEQTEKDVPDDDEDDDVPLKKNMKMKTKTVLISTDGQSKGETVIHAPK